MNIYTFITDETNVQETKDGDFFIYGGLVFSPQQMRQVSESIEATRRHYGFKPEDKLKFDTNSRPKEISPDTYREAKNAAIESCLTSGVQFIAYLILHKIAQDNKTRGEWALNSVLSVFGGVFLPEHESYGIVVIDRLPEQAKAYGMLKRKFQVGLDFPSGNTISIPRVLMYSATCDGASHLSSAVDIVLRSLRWAVNKRKSEHQSPAAKILLNNVAHMMYHKKKGDKIFVRDYGLILRPITPAHPPYKEEYDDLVKYIASLLIEQ